MKNINLKIILPVAAIAVALWYFLQPAAQGNHQLNYQTQKISTGKIESIVNAAGTISPVTTVVVGTEVSGQIVELNADFNDNVTKDQIIARIDDRSIQSRLKQVEADISSSEASLEQSRATLQRRKVELELKKLEFSRQKGLIDKQLISQSTFEQAEINLKLSHIDLDIAKSQVGTSKVRNKFSRFLSF